MGDSNRIESILSQLKSLTAPEVVAELFCDLDDDGQAQFFSEVWRIMGAWSRPAAREMQCYYMAGHMLSCACGEGAREFIAELHGSLQSQPSHGAEPTDAPRAPRGE